MDYELVSVPEPSATYRVLDFAHSCVWNSMKGSWLLTAIEQFIAENSLSAKLVDAALHGSIGRTDCRILSRNTASVVVLPIILQGCFLHHMCCMIIDKGRRRVIYYDPRGNSPINECRIAGNVTPPNSGVLHLLHALACEQDLDIFYSPACEQRWYDFFSCGLHTKAFIERALLFPDSIHLIAIKRPTPTIQTLPLDLDEDAES